MPDEELDINSMMSKIMGNPEFAKLVKSMKDEGSKENSERQEVQETLASEDGASISGNPVSGIPSDTLAHIPEIMAALGPLMKSGNLGGGGSSKHETENRNRLLSALKPYLSDNRRNLIDTVMSISKITNLIDIIPKK